MRTSSLVAAASALAASLVVTSPVRAQNAPRDDSAPRKPTACEAAWSAWNGANDARVDAQLETCVPAHSPFFGFVGAGGWWDSGMGEGSDTGGGVLAQLSSNPVGPLFATTRLRVGMGPIWRFDGDVGLVLSGSRTFDFKDVQTYSGSDARYDYYKVHAMPEIRRAQLVLTGGVHAFHGKTGGGNSDTAAGWQIGLQWHRFNERKNYEIKEVHLIRMDGGMYGVTAGWHNSIPSAPRVVFGMELGYVPSATVPDIFGTIDIGYAFGR